MNKLPELIEVHSSPYGAIYAEPSGPVVRVVRSETPFPSVEAAVAYMSETIQVLDRLGRRGRVLLNDLRAAPGRNDPEFEERMGRLRPELYRGFLRGGVLVRSLAGALQINRMLQEDGITRMVSTDEAELLEYLLHDSRRAAPRSHRR